MSAAYSPFPAVPSRVRSAPVDVKVPKGSGGERALQAILAFAGVNANFADCKGQAQFGDAKGVFAVAKAALLEKGCPQVVEQLLRGSDQEGSKKVQEWIADVEKTFGGSSAPSKDVVASFNTRLAPVAFCAGGGAVSAADLAVFAALHPVVAATAPSDRLAIAHIVRHFAHVQHVLGEVACPPPTSLATVELDLAGPNAELVLRNQQADVPKDKKKEDKKKEKEAKKKAKEERRQQRGGGDGADGGADEGDPADNELLAKVCLKVGFINKAWEHPDSDKLYVEEIDLGEGEPRTICSGLRKFVPLDKMQKRRCVVLANLKPRSIAGTMSNGMLLGAGNGERVELLEPPEGVPVGERITFKGVENGPEEVMNPKKKIWEKLADHMKTNGQCEASFKGRVYTTSKGPVKVETLKTAAIS